MKREAGKTLIAQSFHIRLASTQAACLSICHLCEVPDEGRTTDTIEIHLHGIQDDYTRCRRVALSGQTAG